MTTQPRPPAVTMVCIFVGLSCLMMLVEMYGTISNWGSLEIQSAVEDTLKGTAARSLELDQAMRWLQVGVYVAIVMSIAGMVFAVFTARGDRASRIGLTVLCALAALAFLGGGLAGILPSAFAAVSAAVLWSPPARAWFRGSDRAVPAAFASVAPAAAPTAVTGMPREVFAGATLAVVGSVVSGSVVGFNALAVALRRLAPTEFETMLGHDPLFAESLFGIGSTPTTDTVVVIVSLALTAFALAGFALGVALLMGHARARRPLLLAAYLSVVLSAGAFPIGLPVTVASVATISLLNRAAARRWR